VPPSTAELIVCETILLMFGAMMQAIVLRFQPFMCENLSRPRVTGYGHVAISFEPLSVMKIRLFLINKSADNYDKKRLFHFSYNFALLLV